MVKNSRSPLDRLSFSTIGLLSVLVTIAIVTAGGALQGSVIGERWGVLMSMLDSSTNSVTTETTTTTTYPAAQSASVSVPTAACGGPGQACCDVPILSDLPSCSPGLACNAQNRCGPCGTPGQICCPQAPRCVTPGYGCDVVSYTCRESANPACGNQGQPCCAGNTCMGETLTCRSRPGLTSICMACGRVGQECCTIGSSSLICDAGSYCAPNADRRWQCFSLTAQPSSSAAASIASSSAPPPPPPPPPLPSSSAAASSLRTTTCAGVGSLCGFGSRSCCAGARCEGDRCVACIAAGVGCNIDGATGFCCSGTCQRAAGMPSNVNAGRCPVPGSSSAAAASSVQCVRGMDRCYPWLPNRNCCSGSYCGNDYYCYPCPGGVCRSSSASATVASSVRPPASSSASACGGSGNPCCGGTTCNPGFTCNTFQSPPTCACGNQNQACCGGTTCTDPNPTNRITCDGAANPMCVRCGDLGNRPCPQNPPCNENLSPGPNGLCTCGDDGLACCHGSQCNNIFGQPLMLTCDRSGPQATCRTCGGAGQSCCTDVLQPHARGCGNGLICGAGNLCVACGTENGPCCDRTPECGNGLLCDSSGAQSFCRRCGSQVGQRCCPGSSCTNGPDLVCGVPGNSPAGTPGQCMHCGGPNEPCCSGSLCSGNQLRCVQPETAGYLAMCRTCGGQGQRCCTGATRCTGNLYCAASDTCEPIPVASSVPVVRFSSSRQPPPPPPPPPPGPSPCGSVIPNSSNVNLCADKACGAGLQCRGGVVENCTFNLGVIWWCSRYVTCGCFNQQDAVRCSDRTEGECAASGNGRAPDCTNGKTCRRGFFGFGCSCQ